MKRFTIRLRHGIAKGAAVLAALLLASSPAMAQYQPRPLHDPATGEKFHIEASAGYWFPTADISVASEGSGSLKGILGTSIDFKRDLGLQDKKLPSFELTLRPSRKSKFRFQYVPIKYDVNSSVQTSFVFNGIRYNVGLPVTATMDWKAYRIGYEYDVLSANYGFLGLILDVKYTDVAVQFQTPINADAAAAKAPIPAIGAIGRYYLMPNISLTAEMTGFSLGWLPKSLVKDNSGHYTDFDIYGTLNFTNSLGIQAGYRSLDVGYALGNASGQCPLPSTGSSGDAGCFTLKGPYLGIVARY